jgi:2-polyprenyl-6-methoxyphenol hydroxylase-like FAD-dependent oxidoreductase
MRGVAQQALERILAEHAHALGVEVCRGDAVESFEDTGARVRVVVRGPGALRELDAAFLVGCDGARSVVRKLAGFDFPGTDPTLTGRQGIVELDHPERLLPLGWRRTRAGMMAYGPRPGRLSIIEFDGPPADRDAPVTAAEFEESLRRVSGADVRITALRSATRWTDNARQSSTYRRGRVLLAGDAAHIHSPFGGQGLNLGLVDATNLGWKLAATVRGDAPEGLLDTYTSERHPVAASVLENTRAQLALMRPDPQTTALRDIVAELLTTFPDVNRHFGEMTSGVGTRYDLDDDDPLVGRLAADGELTIDGVPTRLYSLMHDGRGLFVDGDGVASEAVLAWPSRVRVVKASGARSMLIRPDGCIAWAGRPGGLRPALERWFSAS